MRLSSKAALIILVNIIVTFSVGLAARNYVMNPQLAEVERLNDEALLRNMSNAISFLQTSMENYAAKLLVPLRLAREARLEVDTAGLVLQSAQLVPVRANDPRFLVLVENGVGRVTWIPGVDKKPPDDRSQLQAVATIARQRQQRDPDTEAFSGVYSIDGEPLLLAVAVQAEGAILLVAVQPLQFADLSSINRFIGADFEFISREQYLSHAAEPKALSGLRTRDNWLLWSQNDAFDKPVLFARTPAGPRGYDDEIFTPTLGFALLGTLLLWLLALLLLNRLLILPVRQVSAKLKSIRETRGYAQRLEYHPRDEIGELINECNGLLAMVHDQTSELTALSMTDPLTGLGNRRALDQKLEELWGLATRGRIPISVIAFDIDYFKQYNDLYEHAAGDRVLVIFSRLLSQQFRRSGDLVYRVGGEEFLVLLFDCSAVKARQLAEDAVQALSGLRLQHDGNPVESWLTASAGIGSLVPAPGDSIGQLLREADHNLYAAKRGGRNRVVGGQSETGAKL